MTSLTPQQLQAFKQMVQNSPSQNNLTQDTLATFIEQDKHLFVGLDATQKEERQAKKPKHEHEHKIDLFKQIDVTSPVITDDEMRVMVSELTSVHSDKWEQIGNEGNCKSYMTKYEYAFVSQMCCSFVLGWKTNV